MGADLKSCAVKCNRKGVVVGGVDSRSQNHLVKGLAPRDKGGRRGKREYILGPVYQHSALVYSEPLLTTTPRSNLPPYSDQTTCLQFTLLHKNPL